MVSELLWLEDEQDDDGVKGLPTRLHSRGVRAGRCVSGIGIVIAVQLLAQYEFHE